MFILPDQKIAPKIPKKLSKIHKCQLNSIPVVRARRPAVLLRVEAEALRDARRISALERVDQPRDDGVQLLREVVLAVHLQGKPL